MILIFQRLSILAFRYEHKIVRATDVNWHEPFSTDFSFFEGICRYSPRDLALSITDNVAIFFYHLSVADVCGHTARIRDIGRHWSTLANEIAECAVADIDLVPRLLRIAEVRWYPLA